MCEVLPTIDESSPSPEEDNTRLEQLMITMLEEREKLMDKLRETQEVYQEATRKLADMETDNSVLMRQLQALLPKDEGQEKLQLLLEELKSNGGLSNGHLEEVQDWPIVAEIAALGRELAAAKETITEREEEVQELKAERANMKLLLEHLECLVSRHERSLRVTVLKRQTANTGVSSEVEVLKALKSLFDHHKALDEKVRERLRAANERNIILEEELMLANQEIKTLQDDARRMKRMMAQRNSFRLSANYDAIGFSQEQLSMMQEKDQTISDLQFSLDERTAQLEEVMHHRDELSDRAQELDDDLEVALKELHNLKTEKMRLQQSLQSSQAMQERATQMQAQLSTSQDEVSHLREKNQLLSQQVVKMESHTIECEEELQSLKSSLQSKELALKNAQMTTEEQLRKQHEKLSQAEQRRGNFETRILELEALLEKKSQDLTVAREKERVNQEHIERLQSTVERMLEESNQRLRTHFAEKKALTNEKNSLDEQVNSLHSKLSVSEQENQSLQEQIDKLRRELRLAKQKLDSVQRSSAYLSTTAHKAGRSTDLDSVIAKRRSMIEFSSPRTNTRDLDTIASVEEEGTWDFSEPGAVSRLMSILKGQVDVLDKHLELSRESDEDESTTPPAVDIGALTPLPLHLTSSSGDERMSSLSPVQMPAIPPPSPPPPSVPLASPIRAYRPESIPRTMYRVQKKNGSKVGSSPLGEAPGAPALSPTSAGSPSHWSKGRGPNVIRSGGRSISSSVKKVFRRRTGSGGNSPGGGNWAKKRAITPDERRNSAPPGSLDSSSLSSGQSDAPQRVSLDLSDFMDPVSNDDGDDTKKRKKSQLIELALEREIPFSEWDGVTVQAWLEVWVGVPYWYIAAIQSSIHSGAMLESLTDVELGQELGISNPLHRLKLHLALQEIMTLTSYNKPHLCRSSSLYSEMSHDWISDSWLPSLGLPQYCDVFRICLVDARMLEHLTKKDLRTLLKMVDSAHRNSLQYGITVLKKLDYNKQRLEQQREEVTGLKNVMVWTNSHVIAWAESIGLGDYVHHLHESGVHGGLIALDHDFDADALALALKIPQAQYEVRKLLKTEFSSLLAEGTNRASFESLSHGKIVRRISKRLKVGRRAPTSDFIPVRSSSPVLLPITTQRRSQSPSQESENSTTSSQYTAGSQESGETGSLKEMTV